MVTVPMPFGVWYTPTVSALGNYANKAIAN